MTYTEAQITEALDRLAVATYLDWVNNYLTLDRLAEDYEMSRKAVLALIEDGKRLHEAQTAPGE